MADRLQSLKFVPHPQPFEFPYVAEWFLQVEAIFKVFGIEDDQTKILLVITWLDLSSLAQITRNVDLWREPKHDRITYSEWKDIILKASLQISTSLVGSSFTIRSRQESLLEKF